MYQVTVELLIKLQRLSRHGTDIFQMMRAAKGVYTRQRDGPSKVPQSDSEMETNVMSQGQYIFCVKAAHKLFSEQREKTLTALICCCHVSHSIALIVLHDDAVVKARSQKHLKDPILNTYNPTWPPVLPIICVLLFLCSPKIQPRVGRHFYTSGKETHLSCSCLFCQEI